MGKYRMRLPQLQDRLFMADGGLETTLIFHDGVELTDFAAFALLSDPDGREVLEAYYERYAAIARSHKLGAVLETPTWRANADWGERQGLDAAALDRANREAVALLLEVRARHETADTPIVVSGNIGPRGDGYRPDRRMSVEQAQQYHASQVGTFARTDADMVAAFTMNYVEEAIGITLATKAEAMPVAISFTVETDGRLPTGDTLAEAIARTDELTGGYPLYYMINCAHPTHFEQVLKDGGDWVGRIRGLRANASRRSHAELDEAPDLDIGNVEELGIQYRELRSLLPKLNVVGGCCGTDHRHVDAMCRAMKSIAAMT
jgi:homocysteine S-methyltransferase